MISEHFKDTAHPRAPRDLLPDADPCSLAVEPMTCPLTALRTEEALIRVEAGERAISSRGITPEPRWADR